MPNAFFALAYVWYPYVPKNMNDAHLIINIGHSIERTSLLATNQPVGNSVGGHMFFALSCNLEVL